MVLDFYENRQVFRTKINKNFRNIIKEQLNSVFLQLFIIIFQKSKVKSFIYTQDFFYRKCFLQ